MSIIVPDRATFRLGSQPGNGVRITVEYRG